MTGLRRHKPPHKRGVGMVFQDLALWPHLNARRQLAFALGRRLSRGERRRQVAAALEKVNLGHLEKAYPHELSGGERQRLALARALVTQPRILLLDEPLSGLDLALRHELLEAIRAMVREEKLTTIFVTHELQEASAVADRIAVMLDGAIQGIYHPGEVDRAADALWRFRAPDSVRKVIPLSPRRMTPTNNASKDITHDTKTSS